MIDEVNAPPEHDPEKHALANAGGGYRFLEKIMLH
jgi:hypothetical protein